MVSFGKFLAGGLLGAVFGFLVSPKHGQKAREALFGAEAARVETRERPMIEARAGQPVRPSAPSHPSAGSDATGPGDSTAVGGRSATPVTERPPVMEPAIPEYRPEPQRRPQEEPERVDEHQDLTEAPTQAPEASEVTYAPPEPSEEAVEHEAVEEEATVEEATVEEAEESPFEADVPVWTIPVEEEEPASAMPEPPVEPAAPTPDGVFEAGPEPPAEPLAGPVVEQPTEQRRRAGAPADLKARIEETRRRIQRELEQPFSDEGRTTDQEGPEAFQPPVEPPMEPAAEPPAEPPVEEPAGSLADPTAESRDELAEEVSVRAEASSMPEDVELEPDESVAVEPEEKEEVERVLGVGEQAGQPTGQPVSDEANAPGAAPGQFDQDVMRRRIEETRNRLKAKAFDAMMSGEGTLLGRDGEATTAQKTQDISVDYEVDQTIESTLSEEDM